MVEELVRRRDGPHDVVVDLAVLDRLEDRVARGAEPPFAPADKQGALRVRMELPDLAEEVAAGAAVQRLAREYDGDGVARRLDLRQVTAGLRGRGDAHDAVVACVPLVEPRSIAARSAGSSSTARMTGWPMGTRIRRAAYVPAARRPAAHPAERGANGRHVVPAVTVRSRLGEPLADRDEQPGRKRRLRGCVEHEVDVLQHPVDGERGRPVSGQHRPALDVRVRAVDRRARDRVEEQRGVDAEALRQRKRLGGAGRDQAHPRVDRQLEGARLTDLVARDEPSAADRVEYRLRARHEPGGPETNTTRFPSSAGLRPEHRRVEEAPAGELGGLPRPARADGGGLQPDRLRPERTGDLVRDGQQRPDVEEDSQDGVAPGDGLSDRLRREDPVAGERLDLLGLRFQAAPWPARASDRAMPAPMIPVPMTATRTAGLCLARLSRSRRSRRRPPSGTRPTGCPPA